MHVIKISRNFRNGRYDQILDVASKLAPTYGSATNAIAVMVRQSKLFKDTIQKMMIATGPSGQMMDNSYDYELSEHPHCGAQ